MVENNMKTPPMTFQLMMVVFCVFIVVGACGVSATQNVSTSATKITPDGTPTHRVLSPSATSSPIVKPSTTFTPQPILTPSHTLPIPSTLPPDEAQAAILDLTNNNRGCRLPCWWGFTPGETSWETAHRFLATIALKIKKGSSAERPLYSVYFVVPTEIFPTTLIHNYKVVDGIIERIEVVPGYVSVYSISVLLKTYGPPDEVWIRTYNEAREGDLPFDTVLFYSQQGILARYDSQANKVEDKIVGCPQQDPALVLSLWSPERKLTFIQASSETVEIRNEDWWPYWPLAEATGVDTETFYLTFKDIDNSICLETPANLWPKP
jgi:hypothetical protein